MLECPYRKRCKREPNVQCIFIEGKGCLTVKQFLEGKSDALLSSVPPKDEKG